MWMNKRLLDLVIVCSILLISALAGCISIDPDEDTTPNVPYPLFSNAQETSYKNDTICNILNVSSDLNKTFYVTDSNILDIVNWYENKENLGDYTLLDGGRTGISTTNIDPNNISYGFVQVHKNNKTQGLFIFIIKGLEEMNLEKENLMGVVTGHWDLIKACEKTGNFTSLK
jgi:hypothetical protein